MGTMVSVTRSRRRPAPGLCTIHGPTLHGTVRAASQIDNNAAHLASRALLLHNISAQATPSAK